jgi:SHS2 domain-containing protein
MSGGFKIQDHTADIGIRVWAKTLPELFEEAAGAMISILLDKKEEATEVQKSVRFDAPSVDELLFLWLREILFLIENENVVYAQFHIESHNLAEKDADTYFLSANLQGTAFSKLRHEVCKEIKAVTRHGFYLKKNEPWWETSVLFDV